MKDINLKHVLPVSLMSASVLIGTVSFASTSNASGLNDGAIIAIYNQVNTFDIETAGLGIANAKDSRVIDLAEMVQKDHTAVRQMAADLAIKLGAARTLPPSRAQATANHAKVLQQLGAKSGPAFDKAYLEHEIVFHTTAIDAVNNILIPSAKSEELRALMKEILPGFEHHLAETKRVYDALGYQQ